MKTGIYKHYKNKLYEVISIGIHTETLEEYVIYKALYENQEFIKKYGKNYCFIRPKTIFFDFVEVEGYKKPRFEYIGDKKYNFV